MGHFLRKCTTNHVPFWRDLKHDGEMQKCRERRRNDDINPFQVADFIAERVGEKTLWPILVERSASSSVRPSVVKLWTDPARMFSYFLRSQKSLPPGKKIETLFFLYAPVVFGAESIKRTLKTAVCNRISSVGRVISCPALADLSFSLSLSANWVLRHWPARI